MKKARKGFTLVELLIVIVIIGILSAAMTVSSSKANAAAKAAAIYSNIDAIRKSALIYQLQKGLSFKESEVDDTELKNEVELNLDDYSSDSNYIQYKIKPGVDGEDGKAGKGAYVICSFAADGDYEGIKKVLESYKNIRLDSTNYTVGAFLYHNTPSSEGNEAYDCTFAFDD